MLVLTNETKNKRKKEEKTNTLVDNLKQHTFTQTFGGLGGV